MITSQKEFHKWLLKKNYSFLEKKRIYVVESPDTFDEFADEDGGGQAESVESVLNFSASEHQETLLDKILKVHDQFALTNSSHSKNVMDRFSTTRRTEKLIQGEVAKQKELDISFMDSKFRESRAQLLLINDKVGMEFARQKQTLTAITTLQEEAGRRRDAQKEKIAKLRTPKKRRWIAKPLELYEKSTAVARDIKDAIDSRVGAVNADQEKLGFVYERQFERTAESLGTLKTRTEKRIKFYEKRFEKATEGDKEVKENIQEGLGMKKPVLEKELQKHFKALENKDFAAEKKDWQEKAIKGTLLRERDDLIALKDESGIEPEEKRKIEEKMRRLENSLEWRIHTKLRGNSTAIEDAFDRIKSISRAEQIRLKISEIENERDIKKAVKGESSRIDAIQKSVTDGTLKKGESYNFNWREKPLITTWTTLTKELFDTRTNFKLFDIKKDIVGGKEMPSQLHLSHRNTRSEVDAHLFLDLKKGTVSLKRWLKKEENDEIKEYTMREFNREQKDDKINPKRIKENVQTFSLRVIDGINPTTP